MEKAELRKIFKQKRKDLNEVERQMLSQLIADNLIEKFDLHDKNISIFLPIERFQEINTWNILDQVDAKFYVPVVKEKSLKHILLESEDQLEVSHWGIPEPIYGDEVEPRSFDFVLVPLLAIDQKGNRVGYGAGFYDGFLKDCNPECQFIGLSYFEPVEKISDISTSDISLHYCVTPNSVHCFK